MEILKDLKWRYATKRMNGQKVQQEKIDNILEAIRFAPSSLGLQTYSVVVVESDEMKKKISEKACLQPQVLEGSHLIIFASWDEVTPEKVDAYIENAAQTRGVDVSALEPFKGVINGFLNNHNAEEIKIWTSRQAYIALGVGLLAAAEEKVDATPMEGFDKEEMDKLLGLREKGMKSVVIMALGYRDEQTDPLAKAAKVRRSQEELFTFV